MKFGIIFLMCLGLGACSSDDEVTGVAGTIFGKADSAVEAAGNALPGSSSFTASSVDTLSESCDGQVTDLSSDASGVGEFLGCLLTVNSKSPGTARGAFHLVSEVMQSLEQNVEFAFGEEATIHEGITATVDVKEGTQTVELIVKEMAASAPWNYHVQLCILSITTEGEDTQTIAADLAACESGGFTFETYLITSATQLGFKTIERFGAFSGGTSFLIDSSEENLRFEVWGEGDNARHTRVYVEGAVSATFNLDDVTTVEMAVADQGIENSGNGTDAVYGKYDGTNLCMNTWDDDDNDHSNGVGTGATSDLTAQGTCGSFPVYDGGFFTAGGLETYLTDGTKGVLNFSDSSFGISNYFIDN